MIRLFARRLGNMLVKWADRGRWIHHCFWRPPVPNGVTYGNSGPTFGFADEPAILLLELGRDERCPRCGDADPR